MTITPAGVKEWRNADGRLHRSIDPAYIDGDYMAWCANGGYHRIGAPARIWGDGDHEWYVNNKRHRLDGPSIDCEGHQWWYIDGVRYYNFKDFQAAGKLTDDEITMLILKYGEMVDKEL